MNPTLPPISSTAKAAKTVYFPGLNALRYLAAAAVVFCHVEEVKLHYQLPNHYRFFLVHGVGGLAVTFFFVLSGFLITYLLLKEKEARQDVDVRSFYVRRALRIWPVYFLISLLGLFVMPHIPALMFPVDTAKMLHGYPFNIILYALLMPNVALWLNFFVPYASQLWSVGVEEQFYLFWPWLFKLLKRQLALMVAIVVVFLVLRAGLHFLGSHWLGIRNQKIATALYNFLNFTRIDCMAIGGIGAYFIYGEAAWFRRYFLNRTAEITALVAATLLFVVAENTPSYDVSAVVFPLYSALFLIILVNVACAERPLLRLEGRLWTFLGNISYSVYMYQYLAIGGVLFVFRKLGLVAFDAVPNAVYHVVSQCAVVLLAYLSYRYFESPFLKLKNRFAVVKSTTTPTAGPEASPPAPSGQVVLPGRQGALGGA